MLAEGIIGLHGSPGASGDSGEDRRAPFSLRRILRAFAEAFTHPVTLGYTVAAGLVFGAFVGYLASTQQVLGELYGLGAQFPIYFGANALAFGAASMLNARLVMKFGMRATGRQPAEPPARCRCCSSFVTLLLDGHPPRGH